MSKPNAERPAGVFEDIHTTPRRYLFKLLGVPVEATPYAWISFAGYLLPGLVASILFHPESTVLEHSLRGTLWGAVFMSAMWIHGVGHIISGKLAGAPMDRLLLTATRQVNIYEGDQENYPPRVHIIRSLGGPLLNVLCGVLGLLILSVVGSNLTLILFTFANLAGIFGFLPVQSVDGGTILYYLRRMRESKA